MTMTVTLGESDISSEPQFPYVQYGVGHNPSIAELLFRNTAPRSESVLRKTAAVISCVLPRMRSPKGLLARLYLNLMPEGRAGPGGPWGASPGEMLR